MPCKVHYRFLPIIYLLNPFGFLEKKLYLCSPKNKNTKNDTKSNQA